MIQFAPEDKAQLFNLLIRMPELEERRDRKAMLIRAGLEELISHMQLDGASNVVIPLMISHLNSYGKITGGKDALGRFLKTVQEDVGVEEIAFLEQILTRYQLSY